MSLEDFYDPRNDADSGDLFQKFFRWYRSKKPGVQAYIGRIEGKIVWFWVQITGRF